MIPRGALRRPLRAGRQDPPLAGGRSLQRGRIYRPAQPLRRQRDHTRSDPGAGMRALGSGLRARWHRRGRRRALSAARALGSALLNPERTLDPLRAGGDGMLATLEDSCTDPRRRFELVCEATRSRKARRAERAIVLVMQLADRRSWPRASRSQPAPRGSHGPLGSPAGSRGLRPGPARCHRGASPGRGACSALSRKYSRCLRCG